MIFNKKGFTIVELMIAMTVFAIAATLVLAGVIFIGRQYQQSSNRTAIEEASRNVHRQVTESIKFTSRLPEGPYSNSDGYVRYCFGEDKYIYNQSQIVDGATYSTSKKGLFLADNEDSCGTNRTNEVNLLPPNTRVAYFNFDTSTDTLKTIIINAPDDGGDLIKDVTSAPLTVEDAGCDEGVPGREFCSSVKFESTAIGRLTTN